MAKTVEYFDELLPKIFRDESMYGRLPVQIIKALEAMGEVNSNAVDIFNSSLIPSEAEFGHTASGSIIFYRTDVSAAKTIVSGSQFEYVSDNLFFNIDDDVVFASGSTTSNEVGYTSILESYQCNLYENAVVYVSNETDYIYGVIQSTVGDGRTSFLELLGLQKNIYRQEGETLKSFRKRFRDIQDKITRPAIEAIVEQYFPTAIIKECFERPGPALADDNLDNFEGVWFLDDDGNLSDLYELMLPINNVSQGWFVVYVDNNTDLESDECGLMCQKIADSVSAGVQWYVTVKP
jgi:hypothetical protein